jgi:signal recognition particle GTPase
MSLSKKLSKKDLRNQVAETLISTFEGLKDNVSPKKFRRNIKKASKALLTGVRPPAKKKSTKKIKAPAKPQVAAG